MEQAPKNPAIFFPKSDLISYGPKLAQSIFSRTVSTLISSNLNKTET